MGRGVGALLVPAKGQPECEDSSNILPGSVSSAATPKDLEEAGSSTKHRTVTKCPRLSYELPSFKCSF